MSKASGILLIAVGVGVAAYAMPFEGERGAAPTQEASVTEFVKAQVANPVTATPKASAAMEPTTPRPTVKSTAASVEPKVEAPARSAIVAIVPRAVEKPAAVEPKPQPSAIPGDPVSLARELQRELRRVGCYDGEINGSWTPSSRRAMKAFTDRVNASLPTERPDYILLRLVQSSPERVCGVGCPPGQSMSGNGRCLPDAVLAQIAKRPPNVAASRANADSQVATTSGWSTTTTVATRELPALPEGRMALAGPNQKVAPIRRGEDIGLATTDSGTPDVAANVGQAQQKTDRPQVKSATQRKTKFAAVDNSSRRDEPAPRKKFGPWFFNQQEAWRN